MIKLLTGDCRVTLASLEAGSVQSVVTSPPYFGLRSYNTPPLVWGGDADHEHVWGNSVVRPWGGGAQGATGDRATRTFTATGQESYAACPCGAWLGSLGLEPTPDQFVANLVEVFREVRRVLRDDGLLLINLGDSYAGSGNGSNDHRENGSSLSKNDLKYQGQKPGRSLPAKSLMMMPSRVAMALQQDGWVLRSMIPWVKRSSLPESVRDRPSSAVEYWFLLSKRPTYFWDPDAVRMQSGSEMSWAEYEAKKTAGTWPSGGLEKYAGAHKHDGGQSHPAGRSMRNSDLFWATWQGLLLDEDDEPLVLVVNPAGSKLAHYASFPPKLIEPLIRASTSEKGACPECGAPWVRDTSAHIEFSQKVHNHQKYPETQMGHAAANRHADGHIPGHKIVTTTGWRPSCSHSADLTPCPCVVLDPFSGSGTTLMVADRMGRDAIGCELSGEYSAMTTDRLVGDSPMFTEVEVAG